MDELIRGARNGFVRAFGGRPDGYWAAPGRVNVLGEHTDYNDGFVLPCAIPYYTVVAVAKSASPTWRVWSQAADETVTFGLSRVAPTLERSEAVDGWAGYVAGVVWALRNVHKADIAGARIAIASNVPLGAGLSSSAALESAVLSALCDLYDVDISPARRIAVAQLAENEYVGVPTGILDQTASLLAEPDRLMFVDCRSGAVEQIPFLPADHGMALVIADTGVMHEHADGEYADRRADCERAAAALGVDSLRDVGHGEYLELPDLVLRRRVRHVVTENDRTVRAARLLQTDPADGMRRLGGLLTDSHVSMMADYEITVPAVDHAVAAALRGGAVGARMTGGGFGGSVVALTPIDAVDAVCGEITDTARRADLPVPRFYRGVPSAGAHRLPL